MIDLRIFENYLSGKGDDKDKETIMEWFTSISDEDSLRKMSFPFWNEPEKQTSLPDDKAGYLLDRIHHLIRLLEKPVKQKSREILRYINILTRIAAVLFIPLAICLWTTRDQLFKQDNNLSQSEIYCPPGTRTMFYLPDGSIGWLNGGSKLTFPAKFKDKSREVHLSGEAFFEIKHSSKKKPFIVTVDHIQVKAHGTSFNVMSYPGDKMIQVTLVEGNVDILSAREGTIRHLESLHPGNMFAYNTISSTHQTGLVDIEKETSWKNGMLIFRDDNFDEVIRKCNRRYDVEMIIMDKLLESYTYVGTFEDETLEEFLKLLSMTAPIKYKDLGRFRNKNGTFEKRKIEISYKR